MLCAKRIYVVFMASLAFIAGCAKVDSPTAERSFDSNWKFIRADVEGAEKPSFDDSSWRRLDVPHDWSIDDLPPAADSRPELAAIAGKWRFAKGDDAARSAEDFDDSAWEEVALPAYWDDHSAYTDNNCYGWYRRHIDIPEEIKGADFTLLLGTIDDVDEAWLNGVKIGQTGSFPPDFKPDWTAQRRYAVSAGIVRGDGTDVLAVRVYDGNGKGGIYQEGISAKRIGPFDPANSENGNRTGYVLGGTGWYRKHFTTPDDGLSRTELTFGGVYMDAQFWLNGRPVGTHPYGYTSFTLDVSGYMNPAGAENVLAVCVRNIGKNSRWYSGSGIFRSVQIRRTGNIHIPAGGLFITTPQVSAEMAVVNVSCELRNCGITDSGIDVSFRLTDARGNAATFGEKQFKLAAGRSAEHSQTIEISSPALWSPENPALYTAVVELKQGGKIIDSGETWFGIRKIEIGAENGMRLNGEPILMKGGCIHHDNGPLGSAAIARAEERKVELLKANGYNAIRTSHNPPSTALLDACDRLGMLVIVEAFDPWNEAKIGNAEDYHRFFNDWAERDIASMVRRGRNHPSVVMWSIGNEVPEQFRAEETAKRLREAVLSHDTTRPITQAICSDWGNVARNWGELSGPAFTQLDAGGYNYLPQHYLADHERHPERVMYGSESYPKDALEYWNFVEEQPYIIGDFVWTAIDYLGETGIGHSVYTNEQDSFFMPWPYVNAWCGDLDICGFKKAQSFYRDVVWGESRIEMLVHEPIPEGEGEIVSAWGWPREIKSWNRAGFEGKPLKVNVYTRCDAVRLELNGEVVAEKPRPEGSITVSFDVPYKAGKLCAYAIEGGETVAETAIETTGKPQKILLTPERSLISTSKGELAYVTVEIVDSLGRRVPDAEVSVDFAVSGAGEFLAQASGAPNEPASFQAPKCKTYLGRCKAILRPAGEAGKITLTAKAEGLESATVTIEAAAR
jgi:beta-galactosidase